MSLQEQPFQVLVALLERAGELVWREDLRQKVWPQDTYVEFDHALNTAVKKIRIALGDCANSPQYVETIPKRGYRFLAPVTIVDDPELCNEQSDDSLKSRAGEWVLHHRVAVALIFVVLFSGLFFGMRWSANSGKPADQRLVLAVLPFENSANAAEHASLCDGITQELTLQAGRLAPDRLTVVSRAVSLPYRRTTKTVLEVARELGADYLLEGTLRGDAQRVRVTIELIHGSDGACVWRDEFDRSVGDSLMLETELATAITEKLRSAVPGIRAANQTAIP